MRERWNGIPWDRPEMFNSRPNLPKQRDEAGYADTYEDSDHSGMRFYLTNRPSQKFSEYVQYLLQLRCEWGDNLEGREELPAPPPEWLGNEEYSAAWSGWWSVVEG